MCILGRYKLLESRTPTGGNLQVTRHLQGPTLCKALRNPGFLQARDSCQSVTYRTHHNISHQPGKSPKVGRTAWATGEKRDLSRQGTLTGDNLSSHPALAKVHIVQGAESLRFLRVEDSESPSIFHGPHCTRRWEKRTPTTQRPRKHSYNIPNGVHRTNLSHRSYRTGPPLRLHRACPCEKHQTI